MEAGGVEGSHGAKYECLLFDMDDTLYPMSSGLNLACRKNIEEFMLHRLGMEESEIPRMCLELYKEYGTTMAGLKDLGYEFDNDEFHAYVHGRLPYEALKPDPLLRNLLLSMPQRKIIFTNADKTHAAIVLSKLGLEDCFEGVICFETLNPPPPVDASSGHQTNGDGVADDNNKVAGESNQALTYRDATTDLVVAESVDHTNWVADDNNEVILESDEALMYRDATNDLKNRKNIKKMMVQQIICKPSITAMQAAIRIANVDPNKTIFFDDSARNIATAKLEGLHTVIVGSSNLVPGADHALSSIHNIKEALPQIWEREEEHLDQIIQSTVETVVLA